MKELTIEKEKSRNLGLLEFMDENFIELTESDDERIRNFISNELACLRATEGKGSDRYEELTNAIAWIEKQCEQENKINFTFEDVLALECSMKTAKITKGGDELYKILVPLYNKIHNAYLLEKQSEPMEINPTEFDTRLQALIGKFDSLPKEELIGSLSFWLNVVRNNGTYREEKQGEQKPILDFKAKDWYVSKVDGKIYNAKFMEQNSCKKTIRREEIEKAAFSTSGIIEQTDWFIKGAEWADEHPCCNWLEKQSCQKSIDELTPQEAMDVAVAKCFKKSEQNLTNEMKSAEESLGISSKEYNDIVDECLYGESKSSDKYNIRGIKSKHAKGKLGEMIKEMKSADKIEPKFKNGQWIVWRGNCYKVNYNGCGYELVDQNGLSTSLEYGTVDEHAHLWTLQDAKDGDVLAVEQRYDYPSPFIAIYKEGGLDFFNSHCFTGFDEKFYTGETGHDVKGIHPATKEQRDLLFKKMKEAGYTFDFEKKELKKVEPKFHKGDWIVHLGTENIYQVVAIIYNQYQLKYGDNYTVQKCTDVDRSARLWNVSDAKDGDVLVLNDEVFIYAHRKQLYSIAVAHCFVDSAGGFRFDGEFGYTEKGNSIHPATKEQRDTLMKVMSDAGYKWNAENKQLRKIEQKPAEWSEEDERLFQIVIDILDRQNHLGNISRTDLIACVRKLKSLRPQNNITDEELAQAKKDAYNNALDKIEYHSDEPTFDDGWSAAIWYLKKRNAMPQKQWKPSELQIEALESATANCAYSEYVDCLKELQEQLKQL